MNKYLIIAKSSFMVALSFRANFLLQTIGSVFMISVLYFFWKSIYSNALVINELGFEQAFIYIIFANAIYNLFRTGTDWNLSNSIMKGHIIIDFLKPIGIQYIYFFDYLGWVLANLITVSIPTFVIAFFCFRLKLALGLNLLVFLLSLLLAIFINFHFDYFVGLLAFYTESIWGISTAKEVIITFLSGAIVPLPFFPQAIRQILELLPFSAVYHTPLIILTGSNINLALVMKKVFLQLFWLIALFLFNKLFYTRASRVLTVNGG
jgi:ABC-2 type transport system permease protein